MTLAEKQSFDFVGYEGSKLPGDPNVRSLIQRRAMKHNAEIRKRAGGYEKLNVRQYPLYVSNFKAFSGQGSKIHRGGVDPGFEGQTYTEYDAEESVIAKARLTTAHDLRERGVVVIMDQLSRPVQYPVYPKTPDYSLLDLATPLTVLHLGISTLSYFGSETCCIAKTLSTMPTSVESRRLVAFIPSRYGRVPSVTYATDCLVLRLGQIARAGRLALKENDIATVKPYIKALRALQESIDDEDMRISPETLCASELLGLFEILNGPSDVEKWIRHARGAAKLIELRGPDRFKTDFELSLFMTHTGPIITEAFLSRKTCFLGEERWQRVIHSAIRNDSLVPPEQADLVIKLWASLSKGPNLFKEVESVILSSIPPAEERREGLIQVLIKEQENLKIWLAMAEEYQFGQAHQGGQGFARRATTLMWNYKTGRVAPERQVIWRVLQGTFFLCCLFKTRLLFAMAPSRFPELELICQALAKEVMAMGTDPSLERKESLVGGLFMSEIVWVAKGVIDTKEIWCEGLTKGRLEPSHDSSDMLEGWRFDAWCSAIGRKDR